MTMDKSLKSHGELTRHRNVLSRAERVARLQDEEKWDEEQDVFGLPKVANRKVVTRKKAVEKPGAEDGAAEKAPEATQAKATD